MAKGNDGNYLQHSIEADVGMNNLSGGITKIKPENYNQGCQVEKAGPAYQ